MKNSANNVKNKYSNRQVLASYLGFASQLILVLCVSVAAGVYLDAKLTLGFPLLVWFFPLSAIIGVIWKIIKDTN